MKSLLIAVISLFSFSVFAADAPVAAPAPAAKAPVVSPAKKKVVVAPAKKKVVVAPASTTK